LCGEKFVYLWIIEKNNMNISVNWLKQFVDFDFTLSELENTLTMLGIEVESYINLAEKYENFVIGEVLTKEKHPNADKLSLCKVSIRSEELQIVCGAANVDAGQKVVVGKIGAIIPSNKIKLEKRKIRDIYSEGMICSQTELELGDDSGGIWVLPNDAEVGKTVIEYLALDDIILDVSLTPNKADCLSHIGIAREIAAVMKKKIQLPQIELNEIDEKTDNAVTVEVLNNELCPRYAARIIKNIRNGESPDWLKNKLTNIGLRPRNIVVDVTNYVLMDLGQPLHAFDFSKVSGDKLIVKNGFDGEKFITLDGKERTLTQEMLMICDSEKPIAIAGVMGGQNSEITNETTTVILESAFFNPSSIRKTAKKLGISSDASHRFERGADIDMVIPAINKAAQMIAELTGGKILNDVVEVYPNPIKEKEIKFRFGYARRVIGNKITNDEIANILKKQLGFYVKPVPKGAYNTQKNKNKYEPQYKYEEDYDYYDFTAITVKVPNRRVDILDEIDLIEEVVRIYNYNSIEPYFKFNIDFNRQEIPAKLKPLQLKNKIRKYLANVGFTEILTQNFISPNDAFLITENAITIENPLGEEMSKMRPSLIMSMLKIVSFNIRQGNTNLKLFEAGKIFSENFSDDNQKFIKNISEKEELIIAISGNESPRQWGVSERKFDFFDIKGYVEELFSHIKIDKIKIASIKNDDNIFDENSAFIFIDDKRIGFIGGVKNTVLKKYEIEFPVFISTVDLTTLDEIKISDSYFKPISHFPAMKRDLAFIVDEKFTVGEIEKTILASGSELLKSLKIFDLYKGKNIEEGKRSIGFELTFSSVERTLIDEEIEKELSKIISTVEKNFVAELRQATVL